LGEGDAMAGALFKFNRSTAGTPFQPVGHGKVVDARWCDGKGNPRLTFASEGVSGG